VPRAVKLHPFLAFQAPKREFDLYRESDLYGFWRFLAPSGITVFDYIVPNPWRNPFGPWYKNSYEDETRRAFISDSSGVRFVIRLIFGNAVGQKNLSLWVYHSNEDVKDMGGLAFLDGQYWLQGTSRGDWDFVNVSGKKKG